MADMQKASLGNKMEKRLLHLLKFGRSYCMRI